MTAAGGALDRVIVTGDVAGSEATGIPPAIRSEIVTSTLLFLGYSLEDWDFRTIFKGRWRSSTATSG